MSVTFKRPPAAAKPAGSLGFELFQTAYVVRDLDAAMKTFKDNFGLGEFTMLPMPPMADGASMRIALAWTAGHQIELIEAKGPGLELYTDWMLEGRNIRQHHFGYLIRDDAEWAALEKKLKDEGRDYVSAGDGGICLFIYVDAPELGHYLEFVYPNAEGKAFFEQVAAN